MKRNLLDNLISLKPGFNGPQLAGWTPRSPAQSGLGCEVYADQMIEVEEGVALAADIYLPRKKGRYPAVLAYSAYSKELQASGAPTGTNETGSPPAFTDRGYAHVIVARRGMGRSQGQTIPFVNNTEVEDHAKVIDWISRQDWSDGQVALFGTSYYGMVQAAVAVKRPSALKAFFAIEMCSDFFRHIVMFGGSPQTDFLTLWMGANFTQSQTKLRVPPILRAVLSRIFNSCLQKLWWPFLKKRLTKIMKGFARKVPTIEMRRFWGKVVFDGKTRLTNPMPAGPSGSLDKIEIPFVVVQNPGHFNLHQFGAYDLFENSSSKRKWLLIGPPEYILPCLHWQLEALAFFDHVLKGASNGYESQAPVRYWVEGAKKYKSSLEFPILNQSSTKLYLSSCGDDRRTHRLSLSGPGTGLNRWAAVPHQGYLPVGIEEVENQLLVYEITMEEDTEYSGAITLSLNFSSNEIDSHLIARLGWLESSGNYSPLSMGSIRPSRRTIDSRRSTKVEIAIDMDTPIPLVPDQPVLLKFSLTPQPVFLKKGDVLRLEVGSRTDLLITDQSHGRAQFEMQVPPFYSRNTIHYGADTYIELQANQTPSSF